MAGKLELPLKEYSGAGQIPCWDGKFGDVNSLHQSNKDIVRTTVESVWYYFYVVVLRKARGRTAWI